jgi:hypothetical protein
LLQLSQSRFVFEPSEALVEELLHLSQSMGVIDLTAGASPWAVCCVEQGLPYFGVVLSEVHMQELDEFLVKKAGTPRTPPHAR